MSVLGAVDAVVVTLTMLALMGAAFVVVLLVSPRLAVVAVLPVAVAAFGAAVVEVVLATDDSVDTTLDVVVSATALVVVDCATGFFPPPPHAAAISAQLTVMAATETGRATRNERLLLKMSPPLGPGATPGREMITPTSSNHHSRLAVQSNGRVRRAACPIQALCSGATAKEEPRDERCGCEGIARGRSKGDRRRPASLPAGGRQGRRRDVDRELRRGVR